MDTYEKRMVEDIEAVQVGCYNDIHNLHKYPKEISGQILGKLIEWACQPQNVTAIILARKKIDEINKDWLKLCLLDVAGEYIDFSDYWEYRRLLELVVQVLPELRTAALELCGDSEDEDIREVIEDFRFCGSDSRFQG